jgi:transposase
MAKRTTICAGIDTGKWKLDVALDGSSEQLQVENTPEGHKALLAWLRQHRVKRIGIEASGGYEQPIVADLRRKRFVVVVFQPAQVRAYAKFHLQRAKNDKIDAALIATCTAAVKTIHDPPDARLLPFAEHLTMINQIGEDIARLKNRLETCRNPQFRQTWKEDIARLEKREKIELKALVAAIRKHGDLATRLDLIYSVDGIGLPTAVAILVRMPEIGQITREQAAALAGLAPYDDDSGTQVGVRHIAGGRKRLRLALYRDPAGVLSLESAAHRPLPTADRGRKGTQTRAHRLRQEAAHLRQYRRCPRHSMGSQAACGRLHHRGPASGLTYLAFLGSTEAPFLRPDLPSQRRRAQTPSRLVVAPLSPRMPPSPDHALTAASTTSPWHRRDQNAPCFNGCYGARRAHGATWL